MYKKWLLAVLALVIICICSSCASFAPLYERLVQDTFSSYTQIEQYDYVAREGYSYKPATFGYSALDSQEQQVYQQLEKAVYQISERADSLYGSYPIQTIQTDASFSEARFYKVAAAFEIDHPQVFWLDGVYVCQDYAQGRSFQMYSHLSAEACNQAQARFHRQLRNIVELVPQGLSEYERELFLHDYIIDSCTYVDDGEWSRYSPYGAIVNKQAVCEGYSEALQLLFSCVGIESCVLFGEYENEAHEWNLVKINGEWYHLDATWNDMDQDVSEADDHLYFNISDAVIESNDHTIAPLYSSMTEEDVCNADEEYIALFNLFVPRCESLQQNFFYQNGAFITRLDGTLEEQPLGKMAELAEEKEAPEIYLLLDQGISMQQADDALFEQEPYLFFSYANAVNQMGGENQLDDTSTFTYSMPGYNNLIIAQLQYR